MTVGSMLTDSFFEINSGKQLENLAENATKSIHGLSLSLVGFGVCAFTGSLCLKGSTLSSFQDMKLRGI
jgi:hypothetical protein